MRKHKSQYVEKEVLKIEQKDLTNVRRCVRVIMAEDKSLLTIN